MTINHRNLQLTHTEGKKKETITNVFSIMFTKESKESLRFVRQVDWLPKTMFSQIYSLYQTKTTQRIALKMKGMFQNYFPV